MATGRHRNTSSTRAVLASPLGVTALLVGLIVLASIAVPLGARYLGCGETHYLRVSASLSIAPVVQQAAAEFNKGDREYSGDCVSAQAAETPPHLAMTGLSGGAAARSTTTPDVWVPESSAWVELARISETGAQTIETSPRSLASSPVVLAAPKGAKGVPGQGDAGWDLVLPGERSPDRPLVMVDPNRGADGMATMFAARRELGTGDKADAAMTEFVRDVQLDSAFGEIQPEAVYSDAGASAPLTVLPEQAVWDYNNNGDPPTPLEALYPKEGTVELDYPFVSTSDDPRMRAAADDLYDILSGPAYREELRELGFREPDGTASGVVEDGEGIVAEPPKAGDDLTGDALLASVEDWNRLSMPSRALVLADVSGEMSDDLDGGDQTRMEVAVDAAQLGLSLFPDKTDLGLWTLSSELSPVGRKEVEDLGRLDRTADAPDQTRRERLQRIAGDITVEGGKSRLYDNILAAYEEMQDDYDEDKINSVILLTAGRDGGSSDISGGELVAELQDRFDPDRPVTMFIIAFGAQPDRGTLTDAAAATSGTLYVTDDPDEIGDIFLSSISRRLCVPNCDE
ncbi:extracellular solute-binding protein [Murinocardiopsis flavida]|uniref:Extracellular solute-binding protein n=1 Tax=Murinocardiopsis flavida TaxID=645275 RepID=A0A2P8DHA7_9ACTN|nr:substrate-binding and VWA domain-containing protein [Murinocardiopsis flavida]PSK96610.1 extracellular solute-binding protein [Murinocardiopsis flavida]